ncbi:hypothetical protein [Catenulispora acidiphila]|uniref:hypothetical protein n=1 Tax=Catenulispora acidiphila TaxID=304895 RepID=UPI00019E030D|nr:hypothetical protein [Catenulispora acidiphila]
MNTNRPPAPHQVSTSDHEDEAERLLTGYMFGPHEWSAPLCDLSAGELRRLLLDEPTNDLAFESLNVVGEALREFIGTAVMVSHDRYFAEQVGFTGIWEAGTAPPAAALIEGLAARGTARNS